MVFKVVLFLTVLGLQNVSSDGKIFNAVKHPKERVIVDFSVGMLDVKPRHKRDTYESELPENGRSQVASLREYLRKLERYMPAIKENIDIIERKYASYNPFNQNNQMSENGPLQSYGNGFTHAVRDVPEESSWRYDRERDFYPPRAEYDDDRDRINTYGQNGVNQTLASGFAQLPRPEISWQYNNDEAIDPMGDIERYKSNEGSDVNDHLDPKNMSPNNSPSNKDFVEADVKEVKHQGMNSPYDECGRPIHCYDIGREPLKPLVININGDCSSIPNELPIQSRGHCRPFKFSSPPHLTPKYTSFLFRGLPRHYCK